MKAGIGFPETFEEWAENGGTYVYGYDSFEDFVRLGYTDKSYVMELFGYDNTFAEMYLADVA